MENLALFMARITQSKCRLVLCSSVYPLDFIYLLICHVHEVFHYFVRGTLVIYARSRWHVMYDRLSCVLSVAATDIDIFILIIVGPAFVVLRRALSKRKKSSSAELWSYKVDKLNFVEMMFHLRSDFVIVRKQSTKGQQVIYLYWFTCFLRI